MITLNNSNIDFGFEDESLGSKYSISLSRNTSNFVFTMDGNERMTIGKNGKVGIGTVGSDYDLDVNGSINASVYLINGIDISTSAITGDTSNYVKITSNLLVGRINDTSNYVNDTSNILIGRINHTSNYVRDTSNLLTGLINDTSNYVRDTSNLFIGRITNTSNYVLDTSNIVVGRITNTSNYVGFTCNILIGLIEGTSNYVKDTCNIFIDLIKLNSINYEITSSGNPISGFIGNYKYMIFTYTTDTVSGSGQTQYDINVIGPESGFIADILMVGGGGAGGRDIGGGGGGGAVLYGSNINIPLGPSTIYVGRGAIPGEVNGKSTGGFGATILGGGSATNGAYYIQPSVLPKANSGGGGAGGKIYIVGPYDLETKQSAGSSNLSSLGNLTGAILYHGYNGAKGIRESYINELIRSGGGGGSGSSGNNGSGGDGVLVNILGEDYYWGGGGGGGAIIQYYDPNIMPYNGGKGGGGPGELAKGGIYNPTNTYSYGNAGTYSYTSQGTTNSGLKHTGGGGGGGADTHSGGNGGSGIIIIKYLSSIMSSISTTPSNYIERTGNILIGRINNTSNYVKDTSNILIRPINGTSNYVNDTSNIFVGNIVNTSNYVNDTSNILARRISDTSNYVRDTCNILIGPINGMSNYVNDTCNILIGRITDTSNYIRDTYNILASRINNTSNLVKDTSNILVGNINNNSNYVEITRNNLVSFVNSELSSKSQWKYNDNNIYYDAGNVGIGTANPVSKLNIYSLINPVLTLENKQSSINGEILGDPPTIIGTIGEYKYLIYTYTTDNFSGEGQTRYQIIVPSGGIDCDILMVGGGGAGDGESGGGGGGGAVYYGKNVKISSGTYYIYIGRGGTPTVSNGFSTYGFGAIIKGGQSAGVGNNIDIASSAGASISLGAVTYNTIDVKTDSILCIEVTG
jgi:hypothetical protein